MTTRCSGQSQSSRESLKNRARVTRARDAPSCWMSSSPARTVPGTQVTQPLGNDSLTNECGVSCGPACSMLAARAAYRYNAVRRTGGGGAQWRLHEVMVNVRCDRPADAVRTKGHTRKFEIHIPRGQCCLRASCPALLRSAAATQSVLRHQRHDRISAASR